MDDKYGRMSKFEIEGEAVIPKKVSDAGVIYGFTKYIGRKVKVIVLAEEGGE